MTSARAERGSRDEGGVVAVLVAIMALLLLSVSALAVDMGNAYARERQVQSQVDLAALAGGAKLPAGDAGTRQIAANAVVDYMEKNWTFGQSADGADETSLTWSAVAADADTWTIVTDRPGATGAIDFLSATKMRVTAPPALVEFGLAGAMGFDSVEVGATASVEIRSPGNVLPMMLPEGCSWGNQVIKEGSSTAMGPPAFDPPGNGSQTVDRISPSEITQYDATATLMVQGRRWGTNPGAVSVSFTQGSTNINGVAPESVTLSANVNRSSTLTVKPPVTVVNTLGTWYVRVWLGATPSSGDIGFAVRTPADLGCGIRTQGDFGLLDSPRNGVTQLADAFALNTALGLDHAVVTFPPPAPPPVQDSCNGYGSAPVSGALLDDIPVDGRNCVDILNGNKPSFITPGMITGGTAGGTTFTGRLERPTGDGCDRLGGSAERSLFGHDINNDVLTCFLAPGVTVAQISSPTATNATLPPNAISGAILESPRFFWAPVINAPVNPPNGFYPIIDFRAVFITDESGAATSGASNATDQNGLTATSTKLTALQVVAFSGAALPDSVVSQGPGIPYLGVGPRLIRLVE